MDIAIKEFFPILSNSDLFCNMNKTELKATLSYFKAESQSYRKGDILVMLQELLLQNICTVHSDFRKSA